LPELIAPTGHPGLDLLAADFSYRNFAVQLAERRHPTERLLKMSRSLRAIYGALFLDCPAGISLLSENVLRAADVVIVPLVPSPLSIRMLRELYAFVAAEGWTDLVLLPFFSMVDRRRALHLELMASARAEFPAILGTEVPYRSEIERMTVRRTPLAAGGVMSEAALIYRQLWQQIVQQTGPAAAAVPANAAPEVGAVQTPHPAGELSQHL
jgi:cellulose biosynthesis protein BcsQ